MAIRETVRVTSSDELKDIIEKHTRDLKYYTGN